MLPELAFGPWLKERRQALDLTQTTLAQHAGCSANLIQKIEAGIRRPSRQLAGLLAVSLQIPPEEQPGFVQWARGVAGPGAYTPPTNSLSPPAAVLPLSPALPLVALPIPPTAFVGRVAEVAQVRAALGQAPVRLITLSGPPGIGKTRLAFEAARAAQDAFADGICLVALAPLTDPALVAATIAGALGLPPAPGRSLLASLQDYLRDRQMLLLLDTFEQVLPAASLVAELLQAAPQLKILVTSRAALRVRGEKEVPVPPLALPDPAALPPLDLLAETEAVALFLERAQEVQAGFTLTAANAEAVAAICRRLEGIPLAIELAAARSKLLVPAALLTRLERRLALVTDGPRDLPLRQQTLRAAITWSYDLLDAESQALFRRLGVFVGGCSLAAVEAITLALDTAPDAAGSPAAMPHAAILAGLAGLVDHSLLRQVAETEDPRFAMLETIREYAADQLERSGEAPAVHRAHACFFLDLTVRVRLRLQGPEQRPWLRILDQEHDNIRAALRWALDHDECEMALRLASAMGRFWYVRGYLVEGRQWLATALAHSAGVSTALRVRALNQASTLALAQSDFVQCKRLCEETLQLWETLPDVTTDDQRQIATVLSNLGAATAEQGDHAAALDLFERSAAIWRALDERGNLAVILSNMGFLALYQNDYARAGALCEECLGIQRDLGNAGVLPPALINLGLVRLHQGDYAQAQALYQEGLTLARELGDKRNTALALGYLGLAALEQRAFPAATALYQDSLRLGRELGNRFAVARALVGLAAVAVPPAWWARAVHLLAAAQAHHDALATKLTPAERRWYDQTLAAAQAHLPDPAFGAAWAAGSRLPIAGAVAYALAPDDAPLPV
jgi:predicted ATPase/transcriptional regulator with XRE-family HTH domain